MNGNHDQTIDIGIFAHKQDDKYEWAYLGDFLDEDEQSQIAGHIQNSEQQ
ncbi:hypothetical protein [Mucilaginibacter jinjuensis]|uniref:Uncharacterized protein n=1 Tax=Mucilaginibacter jinjuensis TaxID=1176721 RepID=A0ABY7TGV1_9SPHI|nr:hypothetical protein [Mucilaginibacter jinjuensis]WCT14392.1 hypothetical protein PQO05_10650 [Mucilaginibacter jinjuensis]